MVKLSFKIPEFLVVEADSSLRQGADLQTSAFLATFDNNYRECLEIPNHVLLTTQRLQLYPRCSVPTKSR